MTEQQEWYTNKELYEMMVDLSKGLEATNAELSKTQVMIREYNGLRARIDECEKNQQASEGKSAGIKDMWSYVVGGIGVISFILSLVLR